MQLRMQSDINMTNVTVKNYTVVYMCMEIIMFQYQMSPEMFMIPQTNRSEETSKFITEEKAYGGKSSSF